MSSLELLPSPSSRHQRLGDTRDGVLVVRPAPRKVKLRPRDQRQLVRSHGLSSIPRRVGITLKRKFWDSNELVSATVVQARDTLAKVYVHGKESAVELVREASKRTVELYAYARERAATTRLPAPFKPIRDKLVLPCFRAVEYTVQFMLSDKPGEIYAEVKRLSGKLPLGSTIVLPTLYFTEGMVHLILVVVQEAPLPSSERVAAGVEWTMEIGKRAIIRTGREAYYYVQLVDYHVTRTLARAQWDILGFGPYASLPRERRLEVMERIVDRYLSIRQPMRRYEFMAQIRWQNSQLHDDLIGSELIIQRGGAYVEEDTWLDPDAAWRAPEEGVLATDVMPVWFYLEDPEVKSWEPFQPHECRRLEKAYRTLALRTRLHRGSSWNESSVEAGTTTDDQRPQRKGGPGGSGMNGSGHSDSDRESTFEDSSPFSPENAANLVQHDVGAHDVFVEQGRYVVDLLRMVRVPVFWGYIGQGDLVSRGVWMHDSKQGFVPYPDRAALLLEDAYRYLKWFLASQSASAIKHTSEKDEQAGILLTIQVEGCAEGDQLVQFRSLQDIWAVRKTWVGALSLFSRRRVIRGVGPYNKKGPSSSLKKVTKVAPSGEETTLLKRPESPSPEVHTPPPPPAISNLAHTPEVGVEAEERRQAETREGAVSPAMGDVDEIEIKRGKLKWRIRRSQTNRSVDVQSPLDTSPCDDDDFDLNETVDHLVLVVHGIGQAMKRVELGVTQLRSIVECCDVMRNNTDEINRQQEDPQHLGLPVQAGKLPGRVEYLSVEWHTKFRARAGEGEDVTTEGHLRLRDITLSRIPHLRSFVNDALLDVLYFMSPAYHQVILDEVAAEMNRVVSQFRKHTRNFTGKISLAAHSLGGVIAFDLLANQESVVDLAEVKARESADPRRAHLKYMYTSYPRLSFPVVNLFALGSPIGVFLMVRRQHQALNQDFTLARCLRMYNIFHPYDPVAYRLEPFIRVTSYDPDADILPTWQGKYRVHYQVKKMVNRFWERVWQIKTNLEDGIERSLEAVGLIEEPRSKDNGEDEDRVKRLRDDGDENMWPEHDVAATATERYERYGKLCWGNRIDYSLQEKEIEITNEYIFAMGAHVLYWHSKDLSNFILMQLAKYRDVEDNAGPRRAARTSSGSIASLMLSDGREVHAMRRGDSAIRD